jgi:ribose/xylose/arabinose/galactoside ABC-type transport system permease subunit
MENIKTRSLKIARIFRFRELGLLVGLLVLGAIISIASPYFLIPLNLFNILRQVSVVAILAIGETLVLITGGIDLSIGSIVSMTGIIAAYGLGLGLSPWIAIPLGILSGTLAGFINGVVITRLKVNSFIATLGMLGIAQGVALLFSGGMPLSLRGGFQFIGQGKLFGVVPVPAIIMFLVIILAAIFMKRAVLARYIYAVGGSERAALVSGVRIHNVRTIVYMISGSLAGLGGIIVGTNLAVADPTVATGLELDVITAAVIGGASLSGGEGTAWGALIGAMIMGVLRNAFVMLHISGYWQLVVMGAFVILAVAVDNLSARR